MLKVRFSAILARQKVSNAAQEVSEADRNRPPANSLREEAEVATQPDRLGKATNDGPGGASDFESRVRSLGG